MWLKTLPTKGPQVIQGPGENAGVVDIGDGDAVVFKMESHNHPSYIEPYQGAATGVGGIMRDVFTMGARPDRQPERAALRRSRAIPRRAISSPASSRASAATATAWACRPSAARPTSIRGYNGNILVNAMCVGLAKTRQDLLLGRQGRRPAGRLRRLQDRPRRHPRRHHGLGRVRRQHRTRSARPCRSAIPSPRSC